MIFEYALEPALVASWHDRAAWRFFDGKFGVGKHRVACAFPSKDWKEQVLEALRQMFPEDPVGRQNAKKQMDVLIPHLLAEMTRRQGTPAKSISWLVAARKEHNEYPFKGIIVKTPPPIAEPHVLGADDLDETKESEWNPKRPTIPRQTAELAEALAPLLRCCATVKFVDPYFDASDLTFLEPLGAFLKKSQARRTPNTINIELHTSPKGQNKRLKGNPPLTPEQKLVDCQSELRRFLKPGVKLKFFVWDEGILNSEKVHNRYVLTNLGSIAVQAGLDVAHPDSVHTDDLTLLSKEQHQQRWAQYKEGSKAFRCLLGPEVIG